MVHLLTSLLVLAWLLKTSTDVQGHCQREITQTLIGYLWKTHNFSQIVKCLQNRIELVTRPVLLAAVRGIARKRLRPGRARTTVARVRRSCLSSFRNWNSNSSFKRVTKQQGSLLHSSTVRTLVTTLWTAARSQLLPTSTQIPSIL